MPATLNEASKITEILLKYLTPQQAKEIMTELFVEVGMKTQNKSLAATLGTLLAAFEEV